MAYYDYRTGYSVSNHYCPDGDMISSSDVYEWVESSSDRTIFAVRNDFKHVPGVNKDSCNAVWVHEWTDYVRHEWNQSEIADPLVTEQRPAGAKDGSESYYASITESGAEIGWQYTQPNVTREDNSTSQQAEWYWDYHDYDSSSSTNVFETGSECEFAEWETPNSGEKILELSIAHTFTDYYQPSADTNYLNQSFSYQ